MIIGVTGASGCGKTTVLKMVEELGGRALDCDAIYHRLLLEDASLVQAIETRFPGVTQDGKILRKVLAKTVFSDGQALMDLNTITHAAVKSEVERLLEDNPSLACVDAIGLFESGIAQLCDVTVAVTAPRQIRLQRLMNRDGLTAAEALQRMDAQRPQEDFVKACDYHLENDGTYPQFREKCLAFFRHLGIM